MSALARNVKDYPLLSECRSDLRECSLDDNGNGSDEYMFDHPGFPAICFDDVMRKHCARAVSDACRTRIGVARSVDALYVGKSLESWDERISLVEFKNGNLLERPHTALGRKQRQKLTQSLKNSVNAVLEKHIIQVMGCCSFDEISRELDSAVERSVHESFGRLAARKTATGDSGHRNDSFVLESIKTKALCSALLLLSILDVPVQHLKSNVDFVLVYNPDRNPDSDDENVGSGDRRVERVASIESSLPLALGRYAERPLERFSLKKSLGAFFHDVVTCTSDEFLRYRLG